MKENKRVAVMTMAAMMTYRRMTGLPWGMKNSQGEFCFSPELVEFVRKIFGTFDIPDDALQACRENREMFVRIAAGHRGATRKMRKIFDALPPSLQTFPEDD